ncbi:unnamed protein product [Rotaria sp. Silwood1]|nr:unnamed protein product [Rotaria sp. Silwood1]
MADEAATAVSDQQHLDQLEPSFMYSVLFKEIVLEISEDDTKAVKDLSVYCRKKGILEAEIEDFQRKYHQRSPIWCKGTWTSIINPMTYSQSAVERLLSEGGYVLISAGRNNKMPSDHNLSDATIQERTVNLTIDLTNLYAYSSMMGVYNGDNETSFFVILHNVSPDMERAIFIQLGHKYNQESIIYVRRATPTIQQFIYTTGEFSGKYVEGQGYKVLTTNVTDDYSELKLCPDSIFIFTLNFDFEIMIMGKTRKKTRQLIDHHTNYILANRQRQKF